MSKLVVKAVVRTGNGFVFIDSDDKVIKKDYLLQHTEFEAAQGNHMRINVVQSNGRKVIQVRPDTSTKIQMVKKTKKRSEEVFDIKKDITTTVVTKRGRGKGVKTSTAPYQLLKVYKLRTSTNVLRDSGYELLEKDSGNVVILDRKKVEEFFKNPSWDGVTLSERLLGGSGALVDGLTERYYARDDSWHLRVSKDAEFVYDDEKEAQKLQVKDSYTLTDVWANTLLTATGVHKLEKYAFNLINDRTGEKDIYTREQLLNLLDTGAESMVDKYDTKRLKNATLQYYKSKVGAESWRVRVSDSKVTWHVDEFLNKNFESDRLVCLRAYRVKVPTRNGKTQNQYVEFEIVKLNKDDVEDLKTGVITADFISNGTSHIVSGADLVQMAEIPGTLRFPFYDSTKLDNLKLKNKKGTTEFDREVELEVYTKGKLPAGSLTQIEPIIVDIDYDVWKKAHSDHAAKIDKFIKNREDKAVNTVISWSDVLAQPLSDEEMSISGKTFADFWEHRFSGVCRMSTLGMDEIMNEDASIFYDIIPADMAEKIPNTFIVKESRGKNSMATVSVRKFMLDGEPPVDIPDAMGHHWVRFLSCICNALGRKLTLILGKAGGHKYAISCVDEATQKQVLGGNEIYYLPFTWKEEFTVTVYATSENQAILFAKEKANFRFNQPQEYVNVVEDSVKIAQEEFERFKAEGLTTRQLMDYTKESRDRLPGKAIVDGTKVKYIAGDVQEATSSSYDVVLRITMLGYVAVTATSQEEALSEDCMVDTINSQVNFAAYQEQYVKDSVEVVCVLQSQPKGQKTEIQDSGSGAQDFWDELGGDTLKIGEDTQVFTQFTKDEELTAEDNTELNVAEKEIAVEADNEYEEKIVATQLTKDMFTKSDVEFYIIDGEDLIESDKVFIPVDLYLGKAFSAVGGVEQLQLLPSKITEYGAATIMGQIDNMKEQLEGLGLLVTGDRENGMILRYNSIVSKKADQPVQFNLMYGFDTELGLQMHVFVSNMSWLLSKTLLNKWLDIDNKIAEVFTNSIDSVPDGSVDIDEELDFSSLGELEDVTPSGTSSDDDIFDTAVAFDTTNSGNINDLFNSLETVDTAPLGTGLEGLLEDTEDTGLEGLEESDGLDDSSFMGLDDFESGLAEVEREKVVVTKEDTLNLCQVFLTTIKSNLKTEKDVETLSHLAQSLATDGLNADTDNSIEMGKAEWKSFARLLTKYPLKGLSGLIKLVDDVIKLGLEDAILSNSEAIASMVVAYRKDEDFLRNREFRFNRDIDVFVSDDVVQKKMDKSGIDMSKFPFLNGAIQK